MKKPILLIYFLFILNICFAQKETNIWYFGDRTGLDFNTEPPTVLKDSKLYTSEGSGVIADSAGKLLFYSQGDTIWTKEHKIMENGTGLSNQWSISSPSAAIIVRQPISKKYYIFNSCVRAYDQDVFYSIIDMEANNGNGKVIVKRKLLVNRSAEKVALVLHANKRDIWIAIKQGYSDTIFVFLLTPTGISTLVLKTKTYMEDGGTGQMKFSPNGKYLALANVSHPPDTCCYLYNFDNRTGTISNQRKIHVRTYCIEFSPNSKYLYCRSGYGKPGLTQYPIKNIKTDFWPDSTCFYFNLRFGGGSLQLAPNGKIYGNGNDTMLRVINLPNQKGANSNYQVNGLQILDTKYPFYLRSGSLPSFMASYLRLPSFAYTSRCINEPTHFLLLDSLDNDSVKWDFGDVDSKDKNYSSSRKDVSHTYAKYGSYKVSLITHYDNRADTVTEMVYFLNPNPDFTAKDICENDTLRFINKSAASAGELSYNWRFGDGQISTQISPYHFYTIDGISKSFNVTLIATIANGCKDSITKLVTVNENPNSDFIFTTNPNVVNFKAVQSGNTSYKWLFGNGDSALTKDISYTYIKAGKYIACLKVVNAGNCVSKTCKEVSSTVCILDNNLTKGLRIYPNPNQGKFEIITDSYFREISVQIFNSIGKQIASSFDTKNSGDTHYCFNLELTSGIYLVRITSEDEVYSQKIVVETK